MLARVVITRRAALAAAITTGKHLRLTQQGQFKIAQKVRFVPVARPQFVRFYSTQPNQSQKNTEENKEKEEKEENTENKEKEEKEETQEGKEKENENEEKKVEDDTPIVEPAWRTTRAPGAFQKQQPTEKETKVSEAFSYLFYALVFGGGALAVYEGYKAVSLAQKENSADPNLLYRRVLDESIKTLTANQKLIDKQARVACVIEESLVQCQAFGKVTSISFPLLQPNTAARVGTVYIDLAREEDTYQLKSAYVDFVFGQTFDLIEAKILKPEDYTFYLFAREFSAEESLRQMYEATEQMALQAQQQQQQQQLQQQRR